MNQQNQSVKTSKIKKIAFVFMSIWSTIFGACAQSQYTNVDVEGFEQAIKERFCTNPRRSHTRRVC